MFKLLPQCLALVAFTIAAIAQPAIKTVEFCNDAGSICLQQFTNEKTGNTYGFAVPMNAASDAKTPLDILVNVSAPLPYGFAGLGSDLNDDGVPKFAILEVMTFIDNPPPGQIVSNGETLISQASVIAPNGTQFVEGPESDGVPVLSPLSSWSQSLGRVNLLFRCENCSAFTAGEGAGGASIKMALIRSESPPIYKSPTDLHPSFLIANVTIDMVTLDLDKLRSANYEQMLKAAGLE